MTEPTEAVTNRAAAGAVRSALYGTLYAGRWLPLVAGVVAVVALALAIGLRSWQGDDTSVWEAVGPPWRVTLLVTGLLVPVLLPVLVAHGLARRTVVVAVTIATLLVAVVGAVVRAGGYLVEHTLVTGDATLSDGHLFDSATQVHLVLVEYSLVFAAYLLSGWLIGAGYYRFGALRGTALLPLAALVIVGVEDALGTGWGLVLPALSGRELPDLGPAPAAGLAGAILAAGLAAAYAQTRTVAIRPRST